MSATSTFSGPTKPSASESIVCVMTTGIWKKSRAKIWAWYAAGRLFTGLSLPNLKKVTSNVKETALEPFRSLGQKSRP